MTPPPGCTINLRDISPDVPFIRLPRRFLLQSGILLAWYIECGPRRRRFVCFSRREGQMRKMVQGVTLFLAFAAASVCAPKKSATETPDRGKITGQVQAVLWRDPTNIVSRNLFYGPGGANHQPRGPFTFIKEDLDGTNPKFVVRGGDGVKWKVKLGEEARPETVATRLVWAVGYFTDEDYFLPDLQVANMPPRLHRSQKLVGPGGTVHNVRLKRYLKGEEKLGNWQWRQDRFTNTRELNGLRVAMAVLNNWDLKDENN